MLLHLAKERFGYLKAKPLRDAVIILRGERFSLRKIAHILDMDIDTIEFQWDVLLQNAR